MLASFGVHGVSRIEVSAYSAMLSNKSGRKMHVQELELYDDQDNVIGIISLYLNAPKAALRVGNTQELDIS